MRLWAKALPRQALQALLQVLRMPLRNLRSEIAVGAALVAGIADIRIDVQNQRHGQRMPLGTFANEQINSANALSLIGVGRSAFMESERRHRLVRLRLSDLSLFRQLQRIVHFDAEIANGRLQLGMSQ